MNTYDNMRAFLMGAPILNPELRACGLYCLELLDEQEADVDSVSLEYHGSQGFWLNIPLSISIFGVPHIPMMFQYREDFSPDCRAAISCVPSTSEASYASVHDYVAWLGKVLRRREGVTSVREVPSELLASASPAHPVGHLGGHLAEHLAGQR